MSKQGTQFDVQINGKTLATATINVADQFEVNLVSLTGQDDAVLAVTAVLADAPAEQDSNVRSETTVISPGDTVTISLQVAKGADSRVETALSTDDEPTHGEPMKCSFCGKSQHEVLKVVAGPNVIICDECIALCHDIVSQDR